MSALAVRRASSTCLDADQAVAELREGVEQPGTKAVLLFCSPGYDLGALASALREQFACPVIGCTTAGQLGSDGYQTGGVSAASLASDRLEVRTFRVSPLARSRERAVEIGAEVQVWLDRLPREYRAFGLLLADGLSLAEEGLVAALYQSLGDLPIVGGSAGDGLRFRETAVYADGTFASDAAVFAVFATAHPFASFKVHHFQPTERKVVITAADPARRVVSEIDGRPAATAYAELVGVTPAQLEPGVFAEHPLMLRLGTDHFIRSVARADPDGSLVFFCAIEEGLVLSMGECVDPLAALARGFREVRKKVFDPAIVIGCDCILRRLEFERRHLLAPAGEFLAEQRVFGFSTYGEQFNAVHVNQTFTAVALGR